MWRLLDQRGAECPAGHNVGHLYDAKPSLRSFYESLDPCNCFNPGIGHTSKFAKYRERRAVSTAMVLMVSIVPLVLVRCCRVR
jgi:D-lactate dehydrogenase